MGKREDIRIEDTWRLEDMFASEEEWGKLLEETRSSLPKYDSFRGKLSESSDLLYECLAFDDSCSLAVEQLYVYARQRSDENTADPKYQDFTARAQSLAVKAASLSSYIVPEILKMPDELLDSYMNSDNGIALYRRSIEILRQRKEHVLSETEEALLAESEEATQGASQIFNMFNNADIKFPQITGSHGEKIQITHGNFIALMEGKDRGVRKEAFEGVYGCYRQFSNTLAATFSSNIKQAAFYASARHYDSSRQYYLSGNEIPEEVYDNLTTTVREALPMLHRYMELRRRVLGVEELHMYDVYTPLVEQEEITYSFEDAMKLVKEGLAPLGEDYLSALQEGFDNRWIDIYESEGKRSGAYSWGAYGTHPYVLLNFNGTLNHVFTLAHEMGHALHSYYSDKNQPFVNAGYKIFVAEVASTCNEALLIRHLLSQNPSKGRQRAYLLNYFLESFRGTVFRQTMFAEFEQTVHSMVGDGEPLTAQNLCEMYHQLNADYFGPAMTVDEAVDMEWGRIPHFYTPFYVYQYATGFAAAVAISSRILKGDEDALEGYMRFLSGGSSMPPIELLKLCGVDMSAPEPVKEALEVFGGLLNELEDCLD